MARKSAYTYGAEAGEMLLSLIRRKNKSEFTKERIKRQTEVIVGMRKGTYKVFQTKKANRWYLQGFDSVASPSTKRPSGPYERRR